MNEVSQKIAKEIDAKGAIPFARFMELSLYCPVYGYYERKQDTLGVRGDYYTSVSVGPLFGELLASQFAAWLAEWRWKPDTSGVKIVEAGAHDGSLAKDILGWLSAHRPELVERLEYWIIEPSTARRQWQQRQLQGFGDRVQWATEIHSLGRTSLSPGIQGIVFSNEFLDALPIRRLGWDSAQRSWFEWGVTRRGDRFAWCKMKCQANEADALWNLLTRASAKGRNQSKDDDDGAFKEFTGAILSDELLAALPDGFTIELCSVAEQWWRQAAEALDWGVLVAIDYGFSAEELLVPERRDGTLRAYRAHRVTDEVLERPGEQDLTAHVNFSAIRSVGEAAGLKTESFISQGQFLVRAFERLSEQAELAEWSEGRTRQFHTLTHPEHLGRPFRVLVQSRLGSEGL